MTATPPTAPSPAPPSPVPPTATPVSVVLLVGLDENGAEAAALRAWAEAKSWELVMVPGEANDGDPMPAGTEAWVSVGDVPAWHPGPGMNPSLPGIVIDPVEVEAAGTVSTVGGPGTRYDQAGFLAGVIAGLASRSQVVSLVDETGSPQDAVLAQSFLQGLRYSCPRCRLIRQAAAEAGPQPLVVGAADVAFVVPGSEADEVWQSLASADVWAVWVGEAPGVVGAELWAGGVAYAPEAMVPVALEALLRGEPARAWSYAIEQDGLRLAGLNPGALSPGRLRLLERAWEALREGSLDIGVDPASGGLR
ncbi:MAG: hypothetical protein AB1449_08275 [Chloroflexota bacterium]